MLGWKLCSALPCTCSAKQRQIILWQHLNDYMAAGFQVLSLTVRVCAATQSRPGKRFTCKLLGCVLHLVLSPSFPESCSVRLPVHRWLFWAWMAQVSRLLPAFQINHCETSWTQDIPGSLLSSYSFSYSFNQNKFSAQQFFRATFTLFYAPPTHFFTLKWLFSRWIFCTKV